MQRDTKIAAGIAAAVTAVLLGCRVPGMGSDSDAWTYAAIGILSRKVGYFPSRLPAYPMYEYLAIALNRLHLPPPTLVVISIVATAACAVLLWRIFEHYQVRAAWLIAPAVVLAPAWAIGGSQAMEYSLAMAFLLGAWLAAIRGSGWVGVLLGLAVGTRWTSLAGLPILWLVAREQRWRSVLWAAGVAAAMYLPTIILWRWRDGWLPPRQEGGLALAAQNVVRAVGIVGLVALVVGLAARPRAPAWPVVGMAVLAVLVFFLGPYEPEYLILALPFLALLAVYRRPEWASVLLGVALVTGTPGAAYHNHWTNTQHRQDVARLVMSEGLQSMPHWLHPRLVVLTNGTMRTESAQFVCIGRRHRPEMGLIGEDHAEPYRKAIARQKERGEAAEGDE